MKNVLPIIFCLKMNKHFTNIFIFFSFYFTFLAAKILNYQVDKNFINYQNQVFFTLRSFEKDQMLWYWAIDLNHLQSFLIPQEQSQKTENTNNDNYFYFELLKENQKKPFYLQNYGLHQTLQKSDCFLLTIDLCPSKNMKLISLNY